ncbi:MAG: hypothetical protein VYB32_01560 [Pseudomonadota bacterium]|nr:hypothetical protein [Pseudomonadota bacterium]
MKTPLVLAALAPALVGCSFLDQYHEQKQIVAESLRDPDSAQFRSVRKCTKAQGIAGEVNAKNAYGGYTGYQRFILLGRNLTVLIAGEGAERFNEAEGKCAPKDNAF